MYFLTVMSASKKLNWKLLKKATTFKKIDLANVDEVFQVIKCKSGAVPPFGQIFNIETFVDQSLID